MFRVRQKVVCVDSDESGIGDWLGDIPVEGSVYTVIAVGGPEPEIGLLLAEITNFPFDGYYRASRFRPAVERKTDISIFTKMLTGKRVSADA